MAVLTIQNVSADGLDASYASAGVSGDKVRPTDRTFIHVKSTNAGSSVTVTVDDTLSTEPTGATSFNPDLSVVIEPLGNRFIGPLPSSRFRNVSDGYADITYSTTASVTVAALRV